MSAAELDRPCSCWSVSRALAQPRWAAVATPATCPGPTWCTALVQQLADLAADAEGEPPRAVPRLDNDLALPDQLRVVAADLLAAGPAGRGAGRGPPPR